MSLLTPSREPPARSLPPLPTPHLPGSSAGVGLSRRTLRSALGALALLAALSLAWRPWLAPPWGEMVAQTAPGCDLQRSACRAIFPDGTALELTLTPQPVRPDGPITLRLRTLGFEPRAVSADLNGETMNMGPNRTELEPGDGGHWTGSTALTACISGSMVWVLVLRAPTGGGERVASFRFEAGD